MYHNHRYLQLLDPEDALNGLFNALQGDAIIKYLSTDSFAWSLKSIKLFAEFFKDPLCRITDISFINALNNVNKIDVLLDTLMSKRHKNKRFRYKWDIF